MIVSILAAHNGNVSRTAEALEWYFETHGPVRPRVDGRWVEVQDATQAPYLQAQYLP